MTNDEKALAQHAKLHGKIEMRNKDELDTKEKLSIYYTPGVAAVSRAISENPASAKKYTWLSNCVAVISDGSAVLGLGNIGPQASLPVMEGKCMLFKHFAGIDAVPIVLDVHSADEIVAAITAIAPSFGAINLEDIAAPICFEVENRLKEVLDIPLMHDDQHGTAIIVLAGLINSMKVAQKDLNNCSIAVSGVGAAGVAVMRLIKSYAPNVKITAVDSKGIISGRRDGLDDSKQQLIEDGIITSDADGDLAKAMTGSDIFIGVSKAGLVSEEMVQSMAKDPIIFAMANPDPEIMPELAKKAGAKVVATGRSDFPNQVNNALAFPGIFRGALDNNVSKITEAHKLAAAETIAKLVASPTPEQIIPSIFNDRLAGAIAEVIR